ncbi:centromere protein V [Pyxicephalus adspersus]|uniref:centromere protein V n=1 Tax=Pyxicephalus adspersus TaxID=30357 RepID=UPI003B5CD77C
MVKAKKSPAKRTTPERLTRAGGRLEAPKPEPAAPDTKKSKAKKAAIRKQVEEDHKEDRHGNEEIMELGEQRQRWINFIKQHSVSPEEAAKLLLDSYEYKGLVKHSGGCHCGAVRFEVWASADIHVFDCNCSICVKKQNRHFIVPASRFKLLKVSVCAVPLEHFAVPNTPPVCNWICIVYHQTILSLGIAAHCLDEGTVRSIHVEEINGKEWEKAMKENKTIRSMSKS